MKKIFFPLFVLIGLSMFSACGDYPLPVDESTPMLDFTVQFKAEYNGDQLTKYKKYEFGTNNYPIYFNRFRTFMSDIYLLKGSVKVPILDVIDVDFTPDNAPSSLSLIPEFKVKVPAGEYTGIGFGVGVKPTLNNKKPSDFAPGYPLNNEIEYWPGWKSFIFSKLEAAADVDKDGNDDNWMQYHTGADPAYVEFQMNQPISVSNTSGKVTISFDIKRMLTQEDGTYYDLVANPATSSSITDLTVIKYIANSFGRAAKVQQ